MSAPRLRTGNETAWGGPLLSEKVGRSSGEGMQARLARADRATVQVSCMYLVG